MRLQDYTRHFIVLAFACALTMGAQAQCGEIAKACQTNIGEGFISDGQSYRAFLVDEEVAEFRTTFFEDSKYRIAACGGIEAGGLTFRVLDAKRNELFSNADYDHIAAWSFQVENTVDCIIEAQLNTEVAESGCAVVLIAFER